MSTEDILLHVFEIVDQEMLDVKKRSDARLYPSEIVTIGLMFALKGGKYRPFYRWLCANLGTWFPNIPEQSRLLRLLRDYSHYTDRFLKQPSFFTIIDTFGIELIHPRREGRSPHQLGKKGKSNGRWIVGIKLAWLVNNRGEVVDWSWDTANEPDNLFRETATQYDEETISLSDFGFRKKDTPQQNLKYCEKGTWNERYLIETYPLQNRWVRRRRVLRCATALRSDRLTTGWWWDAASDRKDSDTAARRASQPSR